jgi:hypothetical protein
MQSPSNHLAGHQCQMCSSIKYTTESFFQKAKEKHGDTYDYSLVDFKSIDTPVTIICKEHGAFQTTGKTHINGSICMKCSQIKQSLNSRSTTEEFVEKSRNTHGDKYEYTFVNYINSKTKVNITCKTHGNFYQNPNSHISGRGCQKCSKNCYSQIAIRWLSFLSQLYGIQIQHAENEGEYCIPDTKMKVDGYCRENNTIYEFHGTLWHGDPRVYSPDDISYFGIRFGDLHQKTLNREKRIKGFGYNYVAIWEKDWTNLNKCVKKIQQKMRNDRNTSIVIV